MAKVRLRRYEIEEYDLPPVRAKCGARAVARPEKTFSWHPGWVTVLILVGLMPYVLVALILTKRMTVPLPLCQRHRNGGTAPSSCTAGCSPWCCWASAGWCSPA